jgi:hypothetical protein
VWKDLIASKKGYVLASMSIIVTLPRSYVHTLSTALDYFSQVIGPDVMTEMNTLRFDTLRVHGGQRGAVDIHASTSPHILAIC